MTTNERLADKLKLASAMLKQGFTSREIFRATKSKFGQAIGGGTLCRLRNGLAEEVPKVPRELQVTKKTSVSREALSMLLRLDYGVTLESVQGGRWVFTLYQETKP